MPYWQIVLASFRIPWRHRYLWLLALFAGEGGGGGGSVNSGAGNTFRAPVNGSGAPNPTQVAQQVGTWLQDHIGLIIAIVIVWLVLVILFFILGAVCRAAVVRAAAEHDAERPFGLGVAWRSGVSRMWSMIRFRLLIVVLSLPVVITFAGDLVLVAIAAANQQAGAAVAFGILAGLTVVGAIPYGIYLGFLDLLGSRALVLETLQGWSSVRRGHELLRKRLGRTLVVWLISIAVGFVVGIGLSVALVLLVLPAVGLAIAAAAASSAVLWVFFGVYLVAFIAVGIVVSSFLAAQTSTYWTLAFRRLDTEYPPAYPAAAMQPPPAPAQ